MSATITPIRPVTREKIIIHCNSDEIAQVGRALMEAAERGPIPTGGTMIEVRKVPSDEPMFTIERSPEPSQTIKVWSYAVGRTRAE
jgi:hypothetical protein